MTAPLDTVEKSHLHLRQPCGAGPVAMRAFALSWLSIFCCSFAGAAEQAASPIVLVADGAGGFKAASASLRSTVTANDLPLQVETFDWTHGPWRIFADQLDRDHARKKGQLLADHVADLLHAHPGVPVSLVGHSAGCAVVLAAAKLLSPGSVDRIVLLAPSVSVSHDLRPALACARRGVHVFYSKEDMLYLGVVTGIFGTTDRERATAAGRVGFEPAGAEPGDAVLYAKLRQYPWEPGLDWTGNHGGHFGAYQPGYLRALVLPLFLPDDNSAPRK